MISKETIKKAFPFLKHAVRWCKLRGNELPAIRRHFSRRRIQRKRLNSGIGTIKVVFLCQYIPAWSKSKALYDALNSDERFETLLLCIPNTIHANRLQDPDDTSNDVYEYYFGHGYKEAVNALIGRDVWFDLRAYSPDYVIYNRYDRSMPLPYTSTIVSEYAKVCLLKYATVLLRAEESMMDHQFARNVYMFFAESEAKRNEFLGINSVLHKLNLSDACCCGIPAVENAILSKGSKNDAWSFSKNGFRAIYAPRWTTDPTWGGSSFLKYRMTFFEIADSHPNVDILVRPHPLMFENFVNTGLISEEEVSSYKAECNARTNIRLDTEKEYLPTFWNSSVLLCDFSSMIIEYFITKKPIIYLTYCDSIECTDLMNNVLKGCYKVKNEKEMIAVLDDLIAGHDPLADVRAEVCDKVLTIGDNAAASDRMKQVLLDRRDQ